MIKTNTYTYFSTNAARGIGLRLPDNAVAPPEVEQEEIVRQKTEGQQMINQEAREEAQQQREQEREATRRQQQDERAADTLQDLQDKLASLRGRVQTLRLAGKNAEADIIEADIRRTETQIRRLTSRIQDTT